MRSTDTKTEVVPEYMLDHQAHDGFLLKRMAAVEEHRPLDEKPHRHHYYTVIWVTEGKGTHQIDFQQFPLRNRMVYFLTPEQVHFLQVSTPPKGWVLEFSPDFLSAQGIPISYLTELQLFANCEEVQPLELDETIAAEWENRVLAVMESEQQYRDLRWLEKVGSLLKAWLIDCHRYKLKQLGEAKPKTSAASRMVREFKALVEQNYRQWHKVADYATALAVSSGHLSEVIKTETHQSAKQIIQDRLLLEARRTARYTAFSLKEAAHALGFDDPSHFAKVFKKAVGTSFLEFRQQEF